MGTQVTRAHSNTVHRFVKVKGPLLSAGVFGNRRLYLGGPMQTDRMHVVHMQPGISGATGILPGIFVGGMEDLLEKVLSGEGSASGVRCTPNESNFQCDAHNKAQPPAAAYLWKCKVQATRAGCAMQAAGRHLRVGCLSVEQRDFGRILVRQH